MSTSRNDYNPHLDRLDLFETNDSAAPIHRHFKKKTKTNKPKNKPKKNTAVSLLKAPFEILFGTLFGPRLRWHVGTTVFISFFWIWPVEAAMIGTSIGLGLFKAGFWILPLWITGLVFAAFIDFSVAFKKSLEDV